MQGHKRLRVSKKSTYLSASIEAFCTVSSMKKESFIVLNEAELMSKPFDLYDKVQ